MRWFTILGFVSIGLASAGSAAILSNFLTERFLYREAEVMTEFINGVIDVERADKPSSRYADWIEGDVEEFFYHLAAMPDVLKANVYSPDGRIVWSTDGDLVGRSFERNDELESAFVGRPVIHMTALGQREKDEYAYLDLQPGEQFVESYLPIWRDRNGARLTDGVVEIYRAPRRLFETMEAGVQRVWLSALGGGMLIFFCLYWIIRRAAKTIKRQERELVANEMLAAVGEMASAVAHSLRNPLASVRSSAELALATGAPKQVEAALHAILSDSDRLETWIGQYLSDTQPDVGKDSAAEVATAIEQTLKNLENSLARQGIRTSVHIRAGLPKVRPSSLTLIQVLNGLLANAVEAMPGGGELSIDALAEDRDQRVRISIKDTGLGLPEDGGDVAFTPFSTTKSTGFGLGLPLAQRVVSRYGGHLSLANGQRGGAVATLLLPAAT